MALFAAKVSAKAGSPLKLVMNGPAKPLVTCRHIPNKAEKMKVMTCLNPLHTALAVLGCILGYNKISDDASLFQLSISMLSLSNLMQMKNPASSTVSIQKFTWRICKTSCLFRIFLSGSNMHIACNFPPLFSLNPWTLSLSHFRSSPLSLPVLPKCSLPLLL